MSVQIFLFKLLQILTFFVAFSAFIGGYALIATNGLGMSRSLLINSPFDSYIIPGLILVFIVGNTQLLATVLLFSNDKRKNEISGVAGFVLIIWIFTQQYLIQHSFNLQILYFSIGIIEIVATMLLMRINITIALNTIKELSVVKKRKVRLNKRPVKIK